MKARMTWSIFAVTALLVVSVTVPGMAQDFKVIVNEDNPVTTIDADELSRIFLKKTTAWPTGTPVVPIDQATKNEVREAFSMAVHKRGASAIKAYWQRMVFSGRTVPPVEKENDDEVMSAVHADPSAVGYVRAATSLRKGVKVVKVTGL